MPLLQRSERSFLKAVSAVAYANPFSSELPGYERSALGSAYVPEHAGWSFDVEQPDRPRANHWRIQERLAALLERLRNNLAGGAKASAGEVALYEDGVLFFLYYRHYDALRRAGVDEPEQPARWRFYREYRRDWQRYLDLPGAVFPGGHTPEHTFACYYQVLRAFHQIHRHIIGNSPPAARLRAAVWQSIFTHDLRRYQRSLYRRMGDFATLITGPSGTGKELVARAIALSRYVPFGASRLTFAAEHDNTFHAINIAAMPATLVESELFGHRRGSFTGAIADRRGRLDVCPALGAVFLDEIGDLDPEIQVKLLRVIETRAFHPIGESTEHRFEGKLIAATNRDLPTAIASGAFREDLYYRLCSDLIETPPLNRQIKESPGVLAELVLFMTRRVAGEDCGELAGEAEEWIRTNLGPDYPWPGNYRELEQCIRNLLIRRDYRPARPPAAPDDPFAAARQGRLTASELLDHYCALVYTQVGSYQETARRLGLDRRTVKTRVERRRNSA